MPLLYVEIQMLNAGILQKTVVVCSSFITAHASHRCSAVQK